MEAEESLAESDRSSYFNQRETSQEEVQEDNANSNLLFTLTSQVIGKVGTVISEKRNTVKLWRCFSFSRSNYLQNKTGTCQCTWAVWSTLQSIGVHFCTSVHGYAVHFIVHLSTLGDQLGG